MAVAKISIAFSKSISVTTVTLFFLTSMPNSLSITIAECYIDFSVKKDTAPLLIPGDISTTPCALKDFLITEGSTEINPHMESTKK